MMNKRIFTFLTLAALFLMAARAGSREVVVCFNGATATVEVSADIQPYITAKVSGADVEVEQSDAVAEEITYRLSGESPDGSFVHSGDYKINLSLEGLLLTSQKGSAIQIKNGKRIAVVIKDSTNNVLTDMEGGSQDACFKVKGHSEFQGGGTLTINGRGKHGYKGKEYLELKASTGVVNINCSVKDGIHLDEYFLMKGGTLNITTTGDGYWDDDDKETKAPSCINSAGCVTINGGALTMNSTGSGGKGVNSDSCFVMNGGVVVARTTGARYIYENYDGDRSDIDLIPDSLKNSPKAIKADLGVCVNDGKLTIFTEQDGGEGLESKDTLAIYGGDLHIETFDDCINAAGNIRISGGNLYLSSFDNDGIDTNQSLYISGGNIVTQGNYFHELGIDVNDRSPYKNFYLTGGTLVSIGGNSQVCYPRSCDGNQPALYYTGTVKVGTELLLYDVTENAEVMRYTITRDYTAEAGGVEPDLCMIFSSPLLCKGHAYELLNVENGRSIGSVASLNVPYSIFSADGANKYDAIFSNEIYTSAGITLPYRKAVLNADTDKQPILVLYMHEAPSRGTDNAQQLKEAAVDSIYSYLATHNMSAIMIAPQCPSTMGWTGKLRDAVYQLQQKIIGSGNVADVYILGSSIGANGVWCQLHYYPGFYSAAMAVAGDPSGYEAQNIAKTPVITVMGTADTVMPLANMESFVPVVESAGGAIRFDVEDGYSHTATCTRGYTTDRLNWLFAHKKGVSTGLKTIPVADNTTDSAEYYDLSGRRVSTLAHGYYICGGKVVAW